MLFNLRFFIISIALLIASGCSTSARFILPEDSKLIVYNREVTQTTKPVAMRPFFWNAAPGVNYRLYQNGNVIKEGKLQTQFRPVSIFWPPYALIYWPMGFGGDCYDLTKANNKTVVVAGCLDRNTKSTD